MPLTLPLTTAKHLSRRWSHSTRRPEHHRKRNLLTDHGSPPFLSRFSSRGWGLVHETTRRINRLYPLTISFGAFRLRGARWCPLKRLTSSLIIIVATELKSPRIMPVISASLETSRGIKTRQTAVYFYCFSAKGGWRRPLYPYNYVRVTRDYIHRSSACTLPSYEIRGRYNFIQHRYA